MAGGARPASSVARSGERRGLEEDALAECLREQLEHWREKRAIGKKSNAWNYYSPRGVANKQVAVILDLSEQQVANFKFDFLARLRQLVKKQRLNEDVFPELNEKA